MFHSQWLATLNRRLRNRCSHSRRVRRDQHYGNQTPSARALVSRNVVESLEDRTLLTAFMVLNTDDSGAGSLRAAIDAANANTGADAISFDASLAGLTIVLTDELLISDDLTIAGLGADQLTISGDNNSRIFNIYDGQTSLIDVEISGLTLQDGNAEYGGAILNRENLSVENLHFTDNTARSEGAGIYSSSGRVSVFGTSFITNQACRGGGIYGINSVLTVIDSDFSMNTVSASGGAIQISGGGLSVSQSHFSLNKAANGAGIAASISTVSVVDSTFFNNSSTNGAGIFGSYSTMTVEESTFSENTAINIVGSPEGGGIYSESGSLTVLDSQFLNNTASIFGGGICSKSNDYFLVSRSLFSHNSAKYGGGIYNLLGAMTVSESEFNSNSATTNDGGGIYHNVNPFDEEVYEVEISQSHFSNNSAKVFGGGIGIQNGSITVSESTFFENTAQHSGGGFYSYFATTIVENSTFEKNSAYYNGGGLGNGGTLSVLKSTFAGNTNGASGGAVYNNSTGTATISNSTITGNQSSNIGGGLYSISELPLTVINSTISLNDAANKGGGIYSHFVTPQVINSIVAGNTASEDAQIFGNFTQNSSIIQDSITGLIDPILRDNGGPTQTHALLYGSFAINAGDNTAASAAELTTDQRGGGFTRIVDQTVDIGAFESDSLHFMVDTISDIDDGDYSFGNLVNNGQKT